MVIHFSVIMYCCVGDGTWNSIDICKWYFYSHVRLSPLDVCDWETICEASSGHAVHRPRPAAPGRILPGR